MLDVKFFADTIDPKAYGQVMALASQSAFDGCKIRIMPDVHPGSGCVIGFTANLGEKVIPNIVGVDIGCGMLTVELGQIDIDFEKERIIAGVSPDFTVKLYLFMRLISAVIVVVCNGFS